MYEEKNERFTTTTTLENGVRSKISAATDPTKSESLGVAEHCAKDGSILLCELFLLPGGKVQGSKRRFCPEESEDESNVDCQNVSLDRNISPQVATSDTLFNLAAAYPPQSEGTVTTNWDEWDDQSDMVSHIDPIAITEKLVDIQV